MREEAQSECASHFRVLSAWLRTAFPEVFVYEKKAHRISKSCGLYFGSYLVHFTCSLLLEVSGSEPCAGGKWQWQQHLLHHLAGEWTGDAVGDAPSLLPATS